MSISKVRLPNNTEEDIKAKYLIQSTSSDAVSAEFSARTVTEDAIANIQKIYGNTHPWNQLIKNGNFSDSDNYWSHTPAATVSVASNSITLTLPAAPSSNYSYLITTQGYINIISGHKYYFHAEYKPAKTGTFVFDWNGAFSSLYPTATANTWNNFSYLLSGSSNVTGRSLSCYPREVTDGYAAGDTFSIRNVMLIDLTVIYGSGNEPTAAEFEAQYPASYYPYDPGSLVSNSATAILSREFNQWDEEWEVDSYNRVRSKNFIPILPSTSYFFTIPNTGVTLDYYDAEKSFISSAYSVINSTIITPSSAAYCKFICGVGYGPTYANNICINISDTAKNGTYEPYNGHQIDLNIPTLTGKLNGAGSSVVIFPNGMQLNGTTRDELTATSAIKRIADDNSVLSTPQTYILDTVLQLQYPVVAGGTEMVLPTSSTAPMKMDVIYGNAADATSNLSSNFISVDSMKAFLNNLGTQMGGTWNMQYNNGKFEFTFSSS